MLFKLQAVFDLPKRLHTALEQGAVEIAVNAFADAAPLLKRYGHKVWPSQLQYNGAALAYTLAACTCTQQWHLNTQQSKF